MDQADPHPPARPHGNRPRERLAGAPTQGDPQAAVLSEGPGHRGPDVVTRRIEPCEQGRAAPRRTQLDLQIDDQRPHRPHPGPGVTQRDELTAPVEPERAPGHQAEPGRGLGRAGRTDEIDELGAQPVVDDVDLFVPVRVELDASLLLAHAGEAPAGIKGVTRDVTGRTIGHASGQVT